MTDTELDQVAHDVTLVALNNSKYNNHRIINYDCIQLGKYQYINTNSSVLKWYTVLARKLHEMT